jgi:uncharacterized protein
MTPIFWAVVALDLALFAGLLILGATGTGSPDGGREMSLFFFVIVPAIIVGGAVLLFVKAESPLWRTVALVIVAGPGLILAGTRVRSAAIDYQVRQNAAGSGYFSGRELKRAAEAVVRHDVSAITALDKSVDVNAKGKRGMTLMELAVTQVFDSSAGSAPVDIVRTLLSRGADPNPGLETATKLPDSLVLSMLLDAGAKPGFANDNGPVVFQWINMMPPANFTALLDHGLDVNLSDASGRRVIIAAAENDRWNFVLLLMDRGADFTRDAQTGARLAELVQSRIESTSERPADMKADIERVRARLSASKAQPASK